MTPSPTKGPAAAFSLISAQQAIEPVLGATPASTEAVGELVEQFRSLDEDSQELLFAALAFESNFHTSWLWEIVKRTTG